MINAMGGVTVTLPEAMSGYNRDIPPDGEIKRWHLPAIVRAVMIFFACSEAR